MAAPASAYFNNGNTKLPVHKVGVQKLDNLMAVFTADYNTANQVKSLFKLDYLLRVDRKNADGSTTATFVGACDINSPNLKYHNASRRSRLKLAKKDGTTLDCYAFTDAGLNTLASSSVPNVTTSQVGNIVITNQVFKSSYYDNSTTHGWLIENLTSGSIRKPEAGGSLAQNTAITVQYANDPFSGDMYAAKKGDTIRISSFIYNPEGQSLSDSVQVILSARSLLLGFHTTYASLAKSDHTTAPSTFYITRPFLGVASDYQDNGYCEVYTDEACTVSAEIGYYSDGSKWYKVEHVTSPKSANVITEKGNAINGQYPINDPANPPLYTTINWLGFTTIFSQSCSVSSPITTYKSSANSKHYKDIQLTQLADTGYYRTGGGTGASGSRFIDITNGVEGYGYSNCP